MSAGAMRTMVLARFVLRRLGVPGCTGSALLLLCAIALGVVLPAAREDESRTGARLAALRSAAAGHSARQGGSPLESLSRLLQSLPPQERSSAFVSELESGARRHGVQFDRIEYHVQDTLGHEAQRFQVSLPARGDYPALRAWLEDLLHGNPSLSLDELGLRRLADGGEELEARVNLSLFLKAAR
jgi:hypothetical protein